MLSVYGTEIRVWADHYAEENGFDGEDDVLILKVGRVEVLLTPRKARRLARRLKKVAAEVEASNARRSR